MHGQVSLEASSREDLNQKLRHWGAKAPDRINLPNGIPKEEKKKALERWILNRFLRLTDSLQPEHFPVQIIERERPDFSLIRNGIELGIEVTTICDEDEQKRWSKEDQYLKKRQGPDSLTPVLLDFDKKIPILALAFQRCLKIKSGKRKSYGEISCILVCYLNSPLFSERLLEALIESFKETAEKSSHGFSDIYVSKEEALFLL